ncbi:MAG: SRPBCC family protein [Litorimonas sp.]
MKISKTTIIDAPVSFVFQILLDVDLAPKWVPMLSSYGRVSGAPNSVGSTYRSEFDYEGYTFEQMSEINAITSNQFIRWSYNTKFCDGVVEYSLSPISGAQTEIEHFSECRYKGLSKILMWIAKSKFRRKSETIMNETHMNFKRLVEELYSSEFG